MATLALSRRNALRIAVGLSLLSGLTACPLSTAGTDAQLIADALNATWRLIIAQVPGLMIPPAKQASLDNAFRAIDLGGLELTTQAVASPITVENFVKGVNEVIAVIVGTPSIPLNLTGPTGDPVSAVLAAILTLMPEVEGSFKLSIPIASIERPAPGAVAGATRAGQGSAPMATEAAEAILTRVAASRPR